MVIDRIGSSINILSFFLLTMSFANCIRRSIEVVSFLTPKKKRTTTADIYFRDVFRPLLGAPVSTSTLHYCTHASRTYTYCILVWLVSNYDHCSSNPFEDHAHTDTNRVPSRLSAILDEELRRCGASGHEVTQDTRLLDVDERLNEAELADWDAKLKSFYWEPEVAPESTLGPGPQLPVDAGITASRERPRLRRLAPAPTSAPIPAPIPAPIVLPKRPGRPASKSNYERKVSCRVIGKKAEQACVRCR